MGIRPFGYNGVGGDILVRFRRKDESVEEPVREKKNELLFLCMK